MDVRAFQHRRHAADKNRETRDCACERATDLLSHAQLFTERSMKLFPIAIAAIALTSFLTRTSLAADAEFKPIEDAMKFAHKAPKEIGRAHV